MSSFMLSGFQFLRTTKEKDADRFLVSFVWSRPTIGDHKQIWELIAILKLGGKPYSEGFKVHCLWLVTNTNPFQSLHSSWKFENAEKTFMIVLRIAFYRECRDKFERPRHFILGMLLSALYVAKTSTLAKVPQNLFVCSKYSVRNSSPLKDK